MAWEYDILTVGVKHAVSDFSSSGNATTTSGQYRVMYSTSNNDVNLVTSSTIPYTGVMQNSPSSGESASIRVLGFTKVWLSSSAAAVSVGDMVQATTDAQVEPVQSATNTHIVGQVWENASSGPSLITILLTPGLSGSSAYNA